MIKTREELSSAIVSAQTNIDSYDCRILVCSGTGCVASGSQKVYEEFLKIAKTTSGVTVEFGPHDADAHPVNIPEGNQKMGVIKTGCQGVCELGPLVRIQKGDKVVQYVKVQPSDCDAIFKASVMGDTVLDDFLYKQNDVAYTDPEEIPFIAKQTRIVLENCGKFDAESFDEYLASGGFSAFMKAVYEMTPDDIIDNVDKSGLRGRGGGGFPAGRKWKQVARQAEKERYVVCNGDEGDPGAFMDGSVMEGDPFKLIEGMMIAPAVRVAFGKHFNIPNGKNVFGKLVNVLHRMGFDEVYDTTFSADVTIMEESAEFLNRVANGGKLPLLTSCCPAWVKFVGDQFPEYTENVSTCRSPQGMLSAITKEWYRDPAHNTDGRKTVVVSIMPCTAKKMEANRPNSYTEGEKDTDFVLTTNELIDMIRTTGILFEDVEPEAADVPFGFGSGAGVIFGVSGGVTEAVIRRLVEGHDKETLAQIAECGVRGDEFIREFTIPYNGIDVKICVASGLGNARKVMDAVKSGEKEYHLIEVMACPQGCINGGGQPRLAANQCIEERKAGIYGADIKTIIRKSNENPLMISSYDTFLTGKEHKLLHNHEFCAK